MSTSSITRLIRKHSKRTFCFGERIDGDCVGVIILCHDIRQARRREVLPQEAVRRAHHVEPEILRRDHPPRASVNETKSPNLPVMPVARINQYCRRSDNTDVRPRSIWICTHPFDPPSAGHFSHVKALFCPSSNLHGRSRIIPALPTGGAPQRQTNIHFSSHCLSMTRPTL